MRVPQGRRARFAGPDLGAVPLWPGRSRREKGSTCPEGSETRDWLISSWSSWRTGAGFVARPRQLCIDPGRIIGWKGAIPNHGRRPAQARNGGSLRRRFRRLIFGPGRITPANPGRFWLSAITCDEQNTTRAEEVRAHWPCFVVQELSTEEVITEIDGIYCSRLPIRVKTGMWPRWARACRPGTASAIAEPPPAVRDGEHARNSAG